jgi:L-alanine-DL-glutamate epimerase-like enolase superfamily enzyme
VETIRPVAQRNVLFVQLHTDEGLVGLGESFFGARTVEAYLHESVADVLLEMPDVSPERVSSALRPYVGFQGAGAEVRGNAAVDLALWDLVGKQAGLPVARLLGGPLRERIGVYNTCAGSGYVATSSRQESRNWGLREDSAEPPWDDLDAFLRRPAALARDLWDEGIRGMKVWPFDQAAERTLGTDISRAELEAGLAVIEAIRSEVGLDMRLMVELHGLWDRRTATLICQALAPFEPFWVEDPLRPDAVDALARLRDDTGVPIATGETCVGRRGFGPLLAAGALDVATVDVQWTGGLTEARKVASQADAHAVAVAPHDCTGPVSLAACCHLVMSQPNGLVQETVRAFLRTWYSEVAEGLPRVHDGHITLTDRPGHGVSLTESVRCGDAAERRVTRR